VQKPKKSLRKAKVFSLKKEKLIREVEKQNKETPRGFDLRTAKCKAGHSKVSPKNPTVRRKVRLGFH
jgi:hypothetical protein